MTRYSHLVVLDLMTRFQSMGVLGGMTRYTHLVVLFPLMTRSISMVVLSAQTQLLRQLYRELCLALLLCK